MFFPAYSVPFLLSICPSLYSVPPGYFHILPISVPPLIPSSHLSLCPYLVFVLQDMFLMAAMGPPGGGRTVISSRLQSCFNIINMTFPTVRANEAGGGGTVEGKTTCVPEKEETDQ